MTVDEVPDVGISADDTEAAYRSRVVELSEASVTRRFNPYVDIDWDAPDMTVVPNDPSWILPDTSLPMGHHPWYVSLPDDRKAQIGMWLHINTLRRQRQLELLLVNGLAERQFALPDGSPEIRYMTHEMAEECGHTLMFQEICKRTGLHVPGAGRLVWLLFLFSPIIAAIMPLTFLLSVLAAEEIVDYYQRSVLRAGAEAGRIPPMLDRCFSAHIAEEARHMSFASDYVRQRVPSLSRIGRLWLSVTAAYVSRVEADIQLFTPKQFFRDCGVPREIERDFRLRSPYIKAERRRALGSMRHLVAELGLMNPVGKLAWRLYGVSGPPTRHRLEPKRKAV